MHAVLVAFVLLFWLKLSILIKYDLNISNFPLNISSLMVLLSLI